MPSSPIAPGPWPMAHRTWVGSGKVITLITLMTLMTLSVEVSAGKFPEDPEGIPQS
jgi:hypothetical protein